MLPLEGLIQNNYLMKTTYIAYVRVSTIRQGAHGVSLQEQKRLISEYAERRKLIIGEWAEEQRTASKCGRPVFKRILKQLNRSNCTSGLLLHKIDRGARNLQDWAALGKTARPHYCPLGCTSLSEIQY